MENAPKIALCTAFALFATVALCPVVNAAGEPPKELGKFAEWDALTYKESGGDVCYAASFPKKQDGHKGAQGETNILVTHWPSKNRFSVISVTADYTYLKGSDVELEIGKARFKLAPSGRSAWGQAEGDDAKIVKAMKSGSEIIVHAKTDQGKPVTDTYSLRGFGKALEMASKTCKVKG